MAFALSTSASTSIAPQSLFSSGSSHNHYRLKPSGLVLPRHTLSRSTLEFSRRRNQDPAIKSSSSKKKKAALELVQHTKIDRPLMLENDDKQSLNKKRFHFQSSAELIFFRFFSQPPPALRGRPQIARSGSASSCYF
ncbi:hypothetical protein Q3G72_032219 [Acer saccharum]|nr:hypothetical protein Q3G72_032219 [Acer saccharum]